MPDQIQIEYVDPRTLVPADYNPREWPSENRDRLLAGLRKFGFVEPIVVRPSDRLMIGGHFRLDIVLEHPDEFPLVPVIFKEMTDDEAKALNILLNNPEAQGRFNLEMLANIFEDLNAAGFDATLTGYNDNYIQQLIESNQTEQEHVLATLEQSAPDQSAEIVQRFQVLISCSDEAQQSQLLQRFATEGLECRALIS